MLLNIFGKKEKEEKENPKENPKEKIKEKVEKKTTESKKESLIVPAEMVAKKEKPKEEDYTTEQCIQIGLDSKEDVKRASKAFFNTKNKKKAEAYKKFEEYLETMSSSEIRKIKNLDFLEFKEKEQQIYTTLRNGFGQFLSKGAHLDDETNEVIEFVFGDIKKFPSKGHRYWYYKIYIWQKRESE